MIDKKPFQDKIDKLKQEGKYRVFNDILRQRGDYPSAIWYSKYNIKKIVNWCSNDYLGMGQHKVVTDAMHTALDMSGAGSGGTRNIGGTSHYHVALENLLAALHRKDRALLYTSAYVANEWTLIALKQIVPDIVYLSDSKNHASLIQGIRHSGAEKLIFQHNDMEDLENKLKNVSGTPCIVFESVYSMDGDVGFIQDICDLADRYGAITYIDEVHAVGLYGETGAGYLEKLGLQDRVDFVNGTLGKAYGVSGGYVAGDATALDAIRLVASGFIFTTSISPVVCAGALASVKYLMDHNDLRIAHQERASTLTKMIQEKNIEIHQNACTHIIPVMIRNSDLAKRISDTLLEEYNIYIQPINFPTVAVGEERLRITPTPLHTDAMMFHLVDALTHALKDR